MGKGRLEAFSDGVIAVIITIMVLELHAPHGADLEAIRPLLPVFLVYALSFINVGIYWNNHHHMFHATEKIDGRVLWTNLHLLFWLSLLPFTTAWMGANYDAPLPTAVYGGDLLACGVAYLFVERAIIRANGAGSRLAAAVKGGFKENLSASLYVAAVPLAFVNPLISDGIFVAVSAMWFIPDRRIEEQAARGR
jgi:uncharacterized membrane protein